MRPSVPLAGLLAAAALGACQSTQEKAAIIRAQGDQALAGREGLKVTRANKDVEIREKTILSDENGTAVVLELENEGSDDQANVPIAIALSDAKGKRVFANDAPGLERALVSMPLLRRGRESYWVHNQIVAAREPERLEVKVGVPRPVDIPADPPHITLSKVELGEDADGAYVSGEVNNRSKVLQKRVTIFCVAKRGGKVVAAGRAVIEKLPPAPTKKPITFTVYFIGNPAGATLDFTVPPVILR